MQIGLIGQKLGMTRLFDDDGNACAVSVIKIDTNIVTQIKKEECEGYSAVQVSVVNEVVKMSKINKPLAGHFLKSGLPIGNVLKEFRFKQTDLVNYSVGDKLDVNIFESVEYVDIQGRSIGKGFAGTIKRHNFSGQRKTHGNSLSHRVPGSIGQNQTPGRVFKGKKMSGHLGNNTCTIKNLKIMKIDPVRNFILIKGAVPGPKGGVLFIRPSINKL